MERSESWQVDRRQLLTGAVVGGVAIGVAGAGSVEAQNAPAQAQGVLPAPDMAAERGTPPELPMLTFGRSGSDFMTDVLKTLDFKYAAANPGSSFRGLQESLINYGANTSPEWLTCCHEETSVAMAHGYYKVTGKPLVTLVHGTVGLQHASMAVYNAYADRVPVIILAGNALDANTRRPGVEWRHSVQDSAIIVRDYTKWDDNPFSLQHFSESMVRGYALATSVPMAPVVINIDSDLQEEELHPEEDAHLSIPRLNVELPPQGDDGALRELAKLLVAAEAPMIVADRYARTPEAIPLLIELAELLQAPVADTGARMNFPNTHPLNHSDRRGALMRQADIVLMLEPQDAWGMTHRLRDVVGRPWRRTLPEGVKVVTLGSGNLLIRPNYQDFQRYAAVDVSIAGDAQASMPSLIEYVKRELSDDRRSVLAARGTKLADDFAYARNARFNACAATWDLSPCCPARVALELWDQIKGEDWALVGDNDDMARQLWDMERHYHHTGGSGAAGVGYAAGAAIGGALANRDEGRLSVSIQPDGDLMYGPGVLWTAAHHQIPLLMVMFNNRGYHQEVMHLQRMANRHNRNPETYPIGNVLTDPNIDFAKMAQSMGWYAEGPITEPSEIREAVRRALAVVKQGEPALLDIIQQPRSPVLS